MIVDIEEELGIGSSANEFTGECGVEEEEEEEEDGETNAGGNNTQLRTEGQQVQQYLMDHLLQQLN